MENIDTQLGIIELLNSKKKQIESNSNIDLEECYNSLESLLRRTGFYGGHVGTSYVDRAYDAFIKGKDALCTFIDELIFEISKVGLPDSPKKPRSNININNTNHQSQQQEQNQNLVFDIFIESIKDELTGKQLKELVQIIKEEPKKELAKNKIVDKLKNFGVGVLSGIVGNILTNPNIISNL